MLVILNKSAGSGTALGKWKRIEKCVEELVGPFRLAVAETPEAMIEQVAAGVHSGEKEFIAAGGDGTVNLVMNAIVKHAPPGELQTVKLGAVGLGSSNDFHKPLSAERTIGDIPFKLDFLSTVSHDICLLTYRGVDEGLHSRRWLVNASVGMTAEANHRFNGEGALLRFMKRFSPWRGMVYAALRTVLGYRSCEMAITLDETETIHARVKNLGIVKNPHFTGSLRYDSPYEPSSGHVYVHLLKNVSLVRLLVTLVGLLRGKFTGGRNAASWRATRVRIQAHRPFAVEGDGEVVTARRAYFSVVPGLLQVCT